MHNRVLLILFLTNFSLTAQELSGSIIPAFQFSNQNDVQLGAFMAGTLEGPNSIIEHGFVFTEITETSLANQGQIKFSIYPNPASSYLRISSTENIKSVAIHDLSSQSLMFSEVNDNTVELDLSRFESQIFVLKIQSDNGQIRTFKVVKQ